MKPFFTKDDCDIYVGNPRNALNVIFPATPGISLEKANRLIEEQTQEYRVHYDSTGMRTVGAPTHKFLILGSIEPIKQDSFEDIAVDLLGLEGYRNPGDLEKLIDRARELLKKGM